MILDLFCILGRVAWQVWPNGTFCLLFWAMVMTRQIALLAHGNSLHGGRWLAATGMLLNAVVTIVNQGKMPVIGFPAGSLFSVWVKADPSHRLLFLADRFWGFSVGDFVIVGGLLLWPTLLWMLHSH